MKHEEATLQTKTALAESLKKFMKKKPLAKITVSEIVNDCNVNRKTFYYHFQDIYALLKWMLEQEAVEVIKNFDILLDYEDAVHFVIQYVKENQHILNCAYDNMGRDELKRFFYNDFSSLVRNVIEDAERRNNVFVTDEFKDFLCDFLTEGTAGILVNGFREKDCLEKSDMVKNIGALIESLPDILGKGPHKE